MMGHSVETMMGWEWDSLLLLVNPAVADTSDGGGVVGDAHALLDSAACGFSVGQSWPEFEDFDTGTGILVEEEEETQQQQQFAKTKPLYSKSIERAGNEERRDPRLDCPNFLAGRVPCACSDNEDEEDEGGGSHSKRVKLSARCQVPACGADLASLKSYHQRHRVCLHCANATSVKLHQRLHRYCQQCGRYVLLLFVLLVFFPSHHLPIPLLLLLLLLLLPIMSIQDYQA
jgi:hypothetical protein